MCGIAGFWGGSPQFGIEDKRRVASAMGHSLIHRGPDDGGEWCDEHADLFLVHRRLSIIDLSPAGHQPMVSQCGRYVIAFNGEIYNHLKIRHELDLSGKVSGWKGNSDTETLLTALSLWGAKATLTRCVGMFAFALWDRAARTLTLARDRLGEKPLYYGWQGKTFLFGSELKAIQAHPEFVAEIDRSALALFLRHNSIPSPYSIYRGIHKLPPGTYLQLDGERTLARPQAYWSARLVAAAGQNKPFCGDERDAADELESLLKQSIGGQMLADVPLGAFLSGGIDSSTVVALMQAQSSRPIRTFTIGFGERGYDEAEHARAVASHLGSEHTELYVTSQDAMNVIPRLSTIYDEPFADSSQIPSCLISSLASSQVKVCLAGDGGDELFGGYNRYFWGANLWRKFGWLPQPLRAALAGVLTTVPPASWNLIFKKLERWLPSRLRYANPGDKLHKVANILAVRSPEEIYLGLVSHWKNPTQLVSGSTEYLTPLTDPDQKMVLPDFEHSMMYLDLITYLPEDILTKMDRASMGASLETREPLLDHRLLEFAWSIPLDMKIRRGQGKWLLRQVLHRYVPKSLMDRPKMGFGIPIDQWLRGPLRSWASELIEPSRLKKEGFFDPTPIQKKWVEHQSGGSNWSYHLWDILMFQLWQERSVTAGSSGNLI